MKTNSIFFKNFSDKKLANIVDPERLVWDFLKAIPAALEQILDGLSLQKESRGAMHIDGKVFIHNSVELPPYGVIKGPAYIGENTELRAGVFIRGNVIVGNNCVLGNSCEFKNCLLFDNVQVPHFNYVGDSILGHKAHLGAGAILSNVRLDKNIISVKDKLGNQYSTGLLKFGACVGDASEIGCNAVLQPGSILYPNSKILAAKTIIIK